MGLEIASGLNQNQEQNDASNGVGIESETVPEWDQARGQNETEKESEWDQKRIQNSTKTEPELAKKPFLFWDPIPAPFCIRFGSVLGT